jgi:hypothetical protein
MKQANDNTDSVPADPNEGREAPQEILVSDPRAGLSPAQMVERKLVSLLRSAPIPVSRLRSPGPRRALS